MHISNQNGWMKKISVQCRGDRAYTFSPAHTALLVIDLQKEFFVEGQGECLDEMRAILPRVKQLIEIARDLNIKVIYTRESYKPDLSDVNAYRRSLDYVGKPGPLGRFCIVGEPGHAFVEESQPLPDETVIDKASFGAFYNTSLDDRLRQDGIDHLILCGVTTQACVHSTLREAVDRGYWCLTVADCCAALEPGMHDAALDLIAGEGHLFGWVADVKDLASGAASIRVHG
jgi:nicotinamidase-related amidase